MLFALACPAAQAGTLLRDRFSIGGGYGATWPETPTSFQKNYEDGEIYTGHIGYGLTQDTALRLSYENMKYDQKSGSGDVTFQPIILALKLHLLHDVAVNPYFVLGAGISENEVTSGPVSDSWTDFAAMGGFGLEFFLGRYFSIGAEGRYHYIEPEKAGKAFQTVDAVGLVNLYFGHEERTGDRDDSRVNVNNTNVVTPAAQPAAPAAAPTTIIVNTDSGRDEVAASSAAVTTTAVETTSATVVEAQTRVEELKQKIERREVPPIVFDTNSDRLMAGSSATLDQVAAIANQYPALKMRIEGHTDNVGDDQKNLQLSQRRADAVKTYLGNKGVDASRITAVGYGESQPVHGNDTTSGRDKNRRVEFKFEQ